jgi:hypothetical protein
MINLNVKIFNPCWGVNVAQDWGIVAESADYQEVLQQPYRIAAIPAFWDQATNFAYPGADTAVDMRKFDLLIISDIEPCSPEHIYNWLEKQDIFDGYVIAYGSKDNHQPIDEKFSVYRPWWMYNLLRLNQFEDTQADRKPFMFDALLGTRRPHRDYIMLALQRHNLLLDQCVVTYRNQFTGGAVDEMSDRIRQEFLDVEQLNWPYVSPNLDPQWESSPHIEKNISPFVPYKIYQQCWYSIIAETVNTGPGFFLTEKTSKALWAKRLFVLFSTPNFLKNLHALGFETFGHVINEDYDQEPIDSVRYKKAFDVVLSLSQRNPTVIANQVKKQLDHNHNRMYELQKETTQTMQNLLLDRLPSSVIRSVD